MSTIGVNQGCLLSPSLFEICIDELEQMITKFVKDKGVEEVPIRNVVIMLWFYVDDEVFFANTLENAQKLMRAFEEYFMYTKLGAKALK